MARVGARPTLPGTCWGVGPSLGACQRVRPPFWRVKERGSSPVHVATRVTTPARVTARGSPPGSWLRLISLADDRSDSFSDAIWFWSFVSTRETPWCNLKFILSTYADTRILTLAPNINMPSTWALIPIVVLKMNNRSHTQKTIKIYVVRLTMPTSTERKQ